MPLDLADEIRKAKTDERLDELGGLITLQATDKKEIAELNRKLEDRRQVLADRRLSPKFTPTKDNQIRFIAELKSVSLSPNDRVYSLRIEDADMQRRLPKIYEEKKPLAIIFNVPIEKEDDEITKWETVQFDTKILKVTLSNDHCDIAATISHEGVVALSKLIQNWKDGIEFFAEGIQQSMF